MPHILHSIVNGLIKRRAHLSDEELSRYVLMLGVSATALFVHVAFSIFFLIVGSVSLMVSHIVGIFVFAFTFSLLEHRHYDLAGVVLSLMITHSALITIYTIGGDNFSHMYLVLVLLMQMVVPFSKKRIPTIFAVIMPLLIVASYLFDLSHVPPHPIGGANQVLAVINILITSSGMAVLISLERFVRGIMEEYQRERMEIIEAQANLDPLTQLYNRRFADMYFDKIAASRRKEVYCVAIGDIDDFKVVNDTYGHGAGDKVLITLAEILNQSTRKTDLVARWGGEEFLLVLNNITLEESCALLEKIRARVEKTPVCAENHTINFTVTFGVADLDPADISKSLEACDQKMYAGKRSGKNKVVC